MKKLMLLIVGVTLVWGLTLGLAVGRPKAACASTGTGSGGIGHLPPDNCAWVGSCGPKLNQCYRLGFGGGSQYSYGNNIPGCLDDSQGCYNVKCRVKQFTDEHCTNLDDDTQVDRRGCKKP